ncbi:MAG: RNA-binding S4 domain-containing protein [Ginsengibacter sp.]
MKFNCINIKPAKHVVVGDEYEVRTEAKKWVIKVVGLLSNRVGYEEAIKNYIDLTPEENILTTQGSAFVFNTGKRQSKQGRPTKREKRRLDDFQESPGT